MNWLKKSLRLCEEEGAFAGPSSLDHEISQLTKIRSEPIEHLTTILNGEHKRPISTFHMLAAREGNYSGRGRFSSADKCHILSRYLPVNGPYIVDQMDSCAYVSQFSSDGSLLVAASQGSEIRIYNVENRWKVHKDIRAKSLRWTITDTCLSPDPPTLVWDRRCLNFKDKPAGVLTGHLEGITYIDSRRDGRYLISNGKDQSIKLWDIRKMTSKPFRTPKRSYNWDYRWMDYPKTLRDMKHPNDQSLATYKGHSVLRTLIRCHFSPVHSTGQKYIYTGSNDGGVYIYDLVTTALVAKVDHHESTVRDCSWHPYYPTLISSSWDGLILRCEFPGNGETPPPLRRRSRRRRNLF